MFDPTLLLAVTNLLAADGDNTSRNFMIGISIFVMVLMLIFVVVFFRYIGLWIQCTMTRASISFPNLVMMSLRKVNPTIIVRSKIMAVQAGLLKDYPISTRQLEAHYLAGYRLANCSGHRPCRPGHSGRCQNQCSSEGHRLSGSQQERRNSGRCRWRRNST